MNFARLMVVAVVIDVAVPSEGLAGVRTGASFTLVTVSEAVSVAVLNGPEPPTKPERVRSSVTPLAPPVVSQAR